MPQNENKKGRSALFLPLALLLVCAVAIFVVSVFFRVKTVEVEGNNFYSVEEVAEASGIQQGDNLFFINRFGAASRIFSRLPYVEGISIEKSLPGGVKINVTESEAIACIYSGEELWAMDRNGKLLSKVSEKDAEVLLLIEGLEADSPAEGDMLRIVGRDSDTADYISDVLDQVYALGLRQKISGLDFSDPARVTFHFIDRFKVVLGPNENTPYKFQLLISVAAGLQPGDCGTLDLSIDSAAHLCYD